MTISAQEIEGELKTAFEVLNEAEKNLAMKLLPAATSRAYYAIFHAARAVLWAQGAVPKTHRGLSHLFGERVIQNLHVDSEYSDILTYARDERELADYHAITSSFEEEEVADLVAKARQFVEKMQELLTTEPGRV